MAISPYDLEQKFEHELDVLEGQIDELLRNFSIYRGGKITISPPKGLKVQHIDMLFDRYTSVGWSSVRWVEDQRDGSYLEFIF